MTRFSRPTSSLRAERTADVLRAGAVAVVRVRSADEAMAVSDALTAGGMQAIELTLTTPGALDVLRALRVRGGDALLLGAGSVLTVEDARAAIDAGASYIVSPVLDLDVMAVAHDADVPAMPGAYTPTELLVAYKAGADVVKLFPADGLGARYLRGLLAPMPFLPIMPTGGVTPDNIGDWLRAGAVAAGLGSALVDPSLVKSGDLATITARARQVVLGVTEARAPRTPAS